MRFSLVCIGLYFFFKQKTVYEMRIRDWSSDVCSSDLVYVPGGRAAYPSSVLMNAIPARVAGVERLVMVTPTPDGVINPLVLAAAELGGVDEIWRIGGAQAIAALAYGTDRDRKSTRMNSSH